MFHLPQPQRQHLQDHRREIGTLYLRVGEFRAVVEILLAVESQAYPSLDATTATLALVGTGLGHGFYWQALYLGAVAITTYTGLTRVDHIANPGHSQGCFRNIGSEHHACAAAPGRFEHPVLLCLAEPGIQRQDVQRTGVAQRLGQFPDIPLPRQKYQNIPARPKASCVNVLHQSQNLRLYALVPVLGGLQINSFHRVGTPRHLYHRRIIKMTGKALYIDSSRGNDQLEVGPSRQNPLQITQQKVNIEAALVRLVNDDRIVFL